MPAEVLLVLHKHSHGFNPLWMGQGLQTARERVLNIWKIISSFEGITFITWRAGDLPELGASLTGAGRQVIRALRHLAWCAQSSSYFFGFVFKHFKNLSTFLTYDFGSWSLGRVK